MFETIICYLKRKEVEYKEKHSLKKVSSIRVGANARIFATPKNISELTDFADFLGSVGVKYKVVGRMSNILPSDLDYEGVIISTEKIKGTVIDGKRLHVFCGNSLPYISYLSAEASLSGFEELSGIPGSIGGAVFGNAGAYGREISELLDSALIYNLKSKKIFSASPRELEFSYRDSAFKRNDWLLLSASFILVNDEKGKVQNRISQYKKRRLLSQPTEPSLGSVFKRQGDLIPARLIDMCSLKGMKIGGAQISEKHAGFIINSGGATSEDVKKLVSFAENKLLSSFNVRAEREIEYLE